jgi:phosphofructokinase-like protein
MRSSGKRIGVLTGGGDCPGLNAVIRAVVKTAINVYDMEVTGILDGYEGLIYPEKAVALGYDEVKGILPQGGTILGSSNRGNPFAFPEERDGKVVAVDYSDRVAENYHRLGLDGLVVIGGDGTLKLATRFKNTRGLNIVGVPKTIDNDLSATDVTFGFDSAVVTATEAIDKLHSTAESHHRIMFVEVMGRDAGWIALHAGLAGGADAILIPEIPYFIEKLQKKIELRESKGRKFSIVVVAEGARPVGGEMSVVKRPAFDLPRLGGAAQRVADEIEKLLEKETRVTVLGHIQRGGSPTPFDRNLGTRFGTAAVHLAAEGNYGRMVCLRGREIDSVDMEVAVEKKKYVDPQGEMVQTARALGIDFCSMPEGSAGQEDVKL